MKRLVEWLVAIAMVVATFMWAAAFVANRDWAALCLLGFTVYFFIRLGRTLQENRRLKEQIRELEMGLGL